jgi:hypothetical protein
VFTRSDVTRSDGGHVTFHLRAAAARRAFLVLADRDGGDRRLIRMSPATRATDDTGDTGEAAAARDDEWAITLGMPAGRYRFRYYLQDDRGLTYHSPPDDADADADAGAGRISGLDALLDVN